MQLVLRTIAVGIPLAFPGIAQQWEIGGLGGFGWYRNSTISNSVISNPPASARVGFPARATIGVSVTENLYHHLGGEFRWLYQWGGPQISSDGLKTSRTGYSNLISYDLIVYPFHSESGLRPYLAAGGGVKIYTGTGSRFAVQRPMDSVALLRRVSQAEPAISIGTGLRWLVHKHTQLRIDFRTYFTPTPDDVIRPTGFWDIHGWLFEFVPTAGISYVF